MNKVILMGRLTRDPEVRYSAGENPLTIARYTLAVDRRTGKGTEKAADFITCAAFGKKGEFAEKYFRQGTKIAITGRIQTGSYTNLEACANYEEVGTMEECREAVEKQKPKKPIKAEESRIRYTEGYICPRCGGGFSGTGIAGYCYHCGQAIDWSEEENDGEINNS